MTTIAKDDSKSKLNFNSVQLNIVTFVDVHKAVSRQCLDNCVHMIDNSPQSSYQGTAELQTTCKQGQVLNWIIYAMDADRRPDGTWPPSVKINNIVFLNKDGQDVAIYKICEDLKVYGGPDKVRSSATPVYYYWAGTIPNDLPVGVYKYRFVLELEKEASQGSVYLNLETPSLNVIAMKS